MRSSSQAPRASSAVAVYVIILVAFATDDEALGWATAAVSVVLAGGSALLLKYLRP